MSSETSLLPICSFSFFSRLPRQDGAPSIDMGACERASCGMDLRHGSSAMSPQVWSSNSALRMSSDLASLLVTPIQKDEKVEVGG